MPSCAGAYVPGDAGSNECPAGSVRIETEAACRTAVAAAGETVGSSFVETTRTYPRGCYYTTYTGAVIVTHFNTDTVGAGRSDSQLLCAAATTGALHADARARAPAHVCAATRVLRSTRGRRVYRAVFIYAFAYVNMYTYAYHAYPSAVPSSLGSWAWRSE